MTKPTLTDIKIGIIGLGYVGLPLCVALAKAGFERSLSAYVPRTAAAALASEAAQQWTAQFNPREVTAAEFRQLFETACE